MGIFIKGGGGKGGGLESVVAGTGISVDVTDPDNPIVSSTVTDTNDKAKVSSNDTTAGYLNGKLLAGTGITLTENNNGGNETLTIAASGGGGSSDITYYTPTLADVENTTDEVPILEVTIPANTWLDGEQVVVRLAGDVTTNSSSVSLTHAVKIGTLVFIPPSFSFSMAAGHSISTSLSISSDPNRFTTQFRFMRNNNQVYFYVGQAGTWSESAYLDIGLGTILIGSFGSINAVSTNWLRLSNAGGGIPYNQNLVIRITGKWATASPSTWIRPFWGSAYKEKGVAF